MSEKELKEKLERLRASRGAHRGVLTKRIGEANEILESEGMLSNEQIKQLDVLHRLLENKLKLVEGLDESFLSLCEVETIQNEIEDSERVLERVVECQKSIQDALTKGKNESSAQESQINPGQGLPGVASTAMNVQAKAKLPKLILLRFRGDVTKWTSFWDSYKTAVHENMAISPIDKFNYLNSLLEGPASRSIQGLSLTEANYKSAIEILHERFGRTQQIISAHMEELLKLPSCSTSERSNSLRFVYDKISVHIRGLSSLGVASDQYGGLLIPVVMSKLPNGLRVRIARETTSAVWKIEELMDVIKREVEAIEVSENVKITEDRNQKSPPYQNKNPKYPTANSLVTKDDQTAKKKPEIRCVYCNDLHYSASCWRVTDPNHRRSILIESKRCFKCLFPGHQIKDCRGSRNCRNCGGRHHQSICLGGYRETRLADNNTNNEEATSLGRTTTTATTSTKRAKGSILLQTATAIATNEDRSKSVPVRILFDNGSQRSYVIDHIKAKLGLTATATETLHLNTFGENAYRKQKCQVVTLPLRSSNDEYVEISALNFPVICSPLPKRIDVTKYPHLADLDLADSSAIDQDSIDILIGSDYYWDIVTGESIRGEFGPTAINSKFGWLLSGPTDEQHVHENSNVVSNLIISGEPLLNEANEVDGITNMLKLFRETESIGITDDIESATPLPIEAKRNEEISFDGRHYEVALPWKEDCFPRTNNYRMCEIRLRSLHFKLKKDPDLLRDYDKIIREQEQTGIVERVHEEESSSTVNNARIYYSPHHAVIRKDRETTKVRVVYDGSAKASKEELSLNDCLETGDNYIPHIFDMLARFRNNPIGLTADIEKAFLMVSIKEEERNMLRFLWFDNPEQDRPRIAQFRFNRLLFGLRPSPSILGATIAHHLSLYRQSEPEMAALLEKSLYVDDLLSGAENDEKTLEIYHKSRRIMADGGFNLRKWNSNSPKVLFEISNAERLREDSIAKNKSRSDITIEDDQSYAKTTTGLDNPSTKEDTVVKVLGLNWDTLCDELYFDFYSLHKYAMSLPLNKRSVLKVTAKIFDPMGFLSPFTIGLKILFQELCVGKINWDETLQGELLRKWKSLLEEIRCFETVRIPRCYFVGHLLKFKYTPSVTPPNTPTPQLFS